MSPSISEKLQASASQGRDKSPPDPPESTEKSEQDEHQYDGSDTEDAEANKLQAMQSRSSIAETMSFPHECAFIAAICLAQFTCQAGVGQALSILHSIGNTYGVTNPGVLSWFIAGYSLTVGTFILPAGRLGDVFGHKKMLVIGYLWFAVWSLVAGLAVYSNSVLFIFARVLSGIGSAITLPCGLAILGASYNEGMRKNLVFSIFAACAPTGSVIGSTFAAICDLGWWPWAFWSTSIVLALSAVLAYLVVPSQNLRPSDQVDRTLPLVEELDVLGAITGVTGLILVNFAWNQAGVVGWQEPYVYVMLILGFIIFAVFIYVEIRVAKSPLLPIASLTSDIAFMIGCVACGWSCFGIWIYYTWQFGMVLRGATGLLVSAWFAPATIAGSMASVATGFMLGRLGPAWVMTFALTMFTAGTAAIMTAPIHQSYWAQFFITNIIMPWGMDSSFPAATVVISNAVPKHHQGIGASLVTTVVNYSISLGLGFAATVEVNVNNGGTTPEDILKGYRGAWYTGIGLSGLGIALSLTYVAKTYLSPTQKTIPPHKKQAIEE